MISENIFTFYFLEYIRILNHLRFVLMYDFDFFTAEFFLSSYLFFHQMYNQNSDYSQGKLREEMVCVVLFAHKKLITRYEIVRHKGSNES